MFFPLLSCNQKTNLHLHNNGYSTLPFALSHLSFLSSLSLYSYLNSLYFLSHSRSYLVFYFVSIITFSVGVFGSPCLLYQSLFFLFFHSIRALGLCLPNSKRAIVMCCFSSIKIYHSLAHALIRYRNYFRRVCLTIKCLPCRVQFHQHFMSSFCADLFLPINYKPKSKHRKAAQNTFVRKSCW